ncbi:hypothetical protein V5P93_001054 [Actinokineospora auranticolor]|uniref:Uncharacterized protein n=1 Tax=Actinokineospora auranticolor TaxID=155976 RepID=A0A2S6GDZ9_9PSEU|nr:hypothetical protein [Actinokineospora auranticolor]PPK63443.1 hypothetical protein CLV40_12856 [Actinokineospora auranticolor]
MTLAQTTAASPGRIAAAREIESLHNAEQCSKAVRTVADHAADAADCQRLLEMLGLDASLGRRP